MMNDATTAAGLSPRQICFTRLGGQGSGAGWQTLNASPVVDGAAVTAFSGIQNANVKFLNHQSFDAEDMAERRVTELRCENGWAFLTRIQYGLTDALGRPCLFAHGYTFTLDELKAGPAAILDVTYGNFAFTPESTAVPLQTLSRVPRRTLRESLDAVGLDEARYRDLVIALYAVLFGGARTSLTIVCDCAEDTIRAVMECLFAALPYPLRGLLTFSTYATNPGAPTTVLFAHPSRTDRRRSFDLASGTGDAIGDAIRARFAKYRIVTYAAEHIDDEAGRDRYYAAVGEELGRLGVDGTRNLNVYNLSDSLLRERANGDGYGTPGVVHGNQQALARLVDVIGLYSQGGATAYRNELLAAVLGEMLDRGYRIPEPVAEPMCRVLSASGSPRLTALYERYLTTVIGSKLAESPQAAASTMAQLLPDRTSQAFLHVRHLLAGNYRGVAVLTAYYTDIVAGCGVQGSSTETVAASEAQFDQPVNLTFDSSGNLYIAESGGGTVRRLTPDGKVEFIAGRHRSYGAADGTGAEATFKYPYDLAIGGDGNIYVADVTNHLIRKITPDGTVTTVAGVLNSSSAANGTGTEATFREPYSIVTDNDGNLLVGDKFAVRKITLPNYVVTTVAGDDLNATNAGSVSSFNSVRGLDVASDGTIYVCDCLNNCIKKIFFKLRCSFIPFGN